MRGIKRTKRFIKRNAPQLLVWGILITGWFGGAAMIIAAIWQNALSTDAAKISSATAGYIAGDDLIRAFSIIAVVVLVTVAGFVHFVDKVKKG